MSDEADNREHHDRLVPTPHGIGDDGTENGGDIDEERVELQAVMSE